MRCWILPSATLLLAVSAAAPLPVSAGPDEHTCPEGTEKHRKDGDRGTVVRCLRADGVPVGPQGSWYPGGQPSEIRNFVAHETGSTLHGTSILWQPDGSRYRESRWDHGTLVGKQITWLTPKRTVTRLYEDGVLLDVFAGPIRPHFRCPDGLVPRVRTMPSSSSGSTPSLRPPPRPVIEFWCEHPSEPARFPAYNESARPMRIECQVTSEGILASIGSKWGSAHADRLPPPKGLDVDDPSAMQALCGQPDFWRERRREGPYVSRGADGAPLEEGPYARGLRHGVFKVHGGACVRWQAGKQLGRVPCPAGPPYRPDPWIAAAWEELDHVRTQLDWPPLGAGPPAERELRIWRFPKPPEYMMLGPSTRGLPRVLRLRSSDGEIHGEIATWKALPELLERCRRRDGDEEGVCRFTDPTPWAWEDMVHELRLLDAWTIPPASAIRIPGVASDPGERRFGIFVEASIDGRVSRDWYGPVSGEPFLGTHQTRGITELVDQVWNAVVSEAYAR